MTFVPWLGARAVLVLLLRHLGCYVLGHDWMGLVWEGAPFVACARCLQGRRLDS